MCLLYMISILFSISCLVSFGGPTKFTIYPNIVVVLYHIVVYYSASYIAYFRAESEA